MITARFRIEALLIAGCLLAASANAQDLKVSLDGSDFAPESKVTVRVGFLSQQVQPPKGYKAARTRYVVCIAGPVKEVPGEPPTFPELGPSMPLPDAYCNQKSQIHVYLGSAEPADDIAQGTSAEHVFADKLPLPKDPRGTLQHPGGSDVWIIARMSYRPPGSELSKVLFGWTRLVYVCQPATPVAPGNGNETCRYRAQ